MKLDLQDQPILPGTLYEASTKQTTLTLTTQITKDFHKFYPADEANRPQQPFVCSDLTPDQEVQTRFVLLWTITQLIKGRKEIRIEFIQHLINLYNLNKPLKTYSIDFPSNIAHYAFGTFTNPLIELGKEYKYPGIINKEKMLIESIGIIYAAQAYCTLTMEKDLVNFLMLAFCSLLESCKGTEDLINPAIVANGIKSKSSVWVFSTAKELLLGSALIGKTPLRDELNSSFIECINAIVNIVSEEELLLKESKEIINSDISEVFSTKSTIALKSIKPQPLIGHLALFIQYADSLIKAVHYISADLRFQDELVAIEKQISSLESEFGKSNFNNYSKFLKLIGEAANLSIYSSVKKIKLEAKPVKEKKPVNPKASKVDHPKEDKKKPVKEEAQPTTESKPQDAKVEATVKEVALPPKTEETKEQAPIKTVETTPSEVPQPVQIKVDDEQKKGKKESKKKNKGKEMAKYTEETKEKHEDKVDKKKEKILKGTAIIYDAIDPSIPFAQFSESCKTVNFVQKLTEVINTHNEKTRLPKVAKGTRDFNPDQMAIRSKCIEKIKAVFKMHGAQEIDTPVFELKETLMGKYGEESKLIYDLEDQGGELLSLRYDLTVPFARYMAVNNLQSLKRFHIAKVYRRETPNMKAGRFREFYQCDIDIAGVYAPLLPEAEIICMVVDILKELKIGDFKIKLSNRKLLDAMIELCGIHKAKTKTICSSIDKLDKQPWLEVRNEMVEAKGLSLEVASSLEKFVSKKGNPFELLKILLDEKLFEKSQVGVEALKEMELLFNYLKLMNVIEYVEFDLSLARGLDYYTGVIYEAVLNIEGKVSSIAGGGRYDGLIGMFSGKPIPAVGTTIGIERIFALVEDKLKGNVRSSDTYVFVASIGKNMIEERVKVVSMLWKAGIGAEHLMVENPKPQKQIEYAFEKKIPLIAWIGEDEIKNNEITLKIIRENADKSQKEDNGEKVKRTDFINRVSEILKNNK